MDIAEKFQKLGVVPVVVLEDTKDAVPLAKALVEGGLSCAEVTFRTEAAEESIRLMTEQFPEQHKLLKLLCYIHYLNSFHSKKHVIFLYQNSFPLHV